MTIYERIKNRRKELDLSADDVAKALNVSRATIYRYESSDIEKLPTSILEPLSKILKTTPSYLMGWDEDFKEQDTYNDKEEILVHKYRSIDDKGRHTVDTILEMEYNRCNKPHLLPMAAHNDFAEDEEELKLIQQDLDDL